MSATLKPYLLLLKSFIIQRNKMNPEVIKTTVVVEKKYTYPNGSYVIYTLKDNELYTYSLFKDNYHYNHLVKDLSLIRSLTLYNAATAVEKNRLLFETESDVLTFNDFDSLYCIPENIIKTFSGEYLNFPIDIGKIHYYPKAFKTTKKAVELFVKFISNHSDVSVCNNFTVVPIPHYNQNSYDNYVNHYFGSGLLKFTDEIFKKSVKEVKNTFYISINEVLYQLEQAFVTECDQELKEMFKKDLEDLF